MQAASQNSMERAWLYEKVVKWAGRIGRDAGADERCSVEAAFYFYLPETLRVHTLLPRQRRVSTLKSRAEALSFLITAIHRDSNRTASCEGFLSGFRPGDNHLVENLLNV